MNGPRKATKLDLFNLQPPKYGIKWKRILFALEVTVSALIIAILCSISSQGSGNNTAQAEAIESNASEQIANAEITDVPDQISEDGACAHSWAPIMRTIDHPQIEHEILHDAEYGTVIVLHTICNECNKVIDGKAQSHIDETGHSGFTTSVPIEEETLLTKPWREIVIDKEAWTETVVDYYNCSVCNAKSDASA